MNAPDLTSVLDFRDQVVLITGGTRGLGRGIAVRFVDAGATVVVCGRKEPEGGGAEDGDRSDAAAKVPYFIAADVRDADSVGALHEQIVAKFGRLDVLVNNAGGSPPADSANASAKFTNAEHADAMAEPPYPIGSHRYMAPEQHRGEIAGPWVDVYAIGVMLHGAVAGELPEPGARLSERCEVSRELDEVVATAIAEDPTQRFASAAFFQDALTRALLIDA